ncbi:MAG: tyrosine--tRNA ligase [Chloroflexi bacterium]|nr:tyrosine--tRNA ligase [Chloroflexota bacterium]
MPDALDLLRERGFVQLVSDEAGLRRQLAEPTTVYCGYDPTSDSLTVGHLVSIMMLAQLQRASHRPIALVGGGTGMVGDPTGKTQQRPILTVEELAHNKTGIRAQLGRFLEFSDGGAVMLDNADWLLDLSYIPFLREIGRHFSVNQLLQHETYRDHFAGEGLSFLELNYVLLQAYDFLHLSRTHGCRLQIGGSDQWFNILAGVDLIRRADGGQAFALVSPLLTTASGAKMGKTEAGAVWLDATRTPPYDFYQYWINVEDADVGRFMRIFTFLPEEEIRSYARLEGADLRAAKERLAFEVTSVVHGEPRAAEAREASRALFGGGVQSDLASVPTFAVSAEQLERGLPILEALELCGLAQSKSRGRQLVQDGAVYVNGDLVESPRRSLVPADLQDGGILLRRGKKQYRRLVLA